MIQSLDPCHILTPVQYLSVCPREEGILPYIPELPRPNEMIVNYNQSVYRLRHLHTAPAGLESTCLVLGYGLGKIVISFRAITI